MLCEFCDELNHPSCSRFARVYAPNVEHRIVARRGDLVAMPTIGQLFPGSLLVLPTAHVETMALLPEGTLSDLVLLLADLESVISRHGQVITFEHGARCETRGGCGIYHAHLHLVPVPGHVSTDDLLPAESDVLVPEHAPSLFAALESLRTSSEYLLLQDCEHQVRFLDLSASSGPRYPSQHFRRALVDLFKLERPWDWRMYEEPEPSLLETLAMFEDSHAPVGG